MEPEVNSDHDPEGFFSEGYSNGFSGREIKIPKGIVGDGNLKKNLSFQGLEVDKTMFVSIDNVYDFTGKNIVS